MDLPSDADVIRDARKDPSKFGLVFDRHYEAIFRFAARRLGGDLADDVAAETFVIALRRIDSYDPDYSSALPWLYGIAHNVMRNHSRSESRRLRLVAEIGDHEEADRAAGPAERIEALDKSAALASGLIDLSDADREALLLFAWAGLPQREIARLQGVPEGTVRSRIHRARSILREHLADKEQIPSDRTNPPTDKQRGPDRQ